MRFLYSLLPAKQAIDDLYDQVQLELVVGGELFLGLVPFWNGIGQQVGFEGPSNYEYRMVAEKDIDAFNAKILDYASHGWSLHMGVTPWQGYFLQWVCRDHWAHAELPVANKAQMLPQDQDRALVVEDAPALTTVVRRVERIFVFSPQLNSGIVSLPPPIIQQ